MSPKARRKPSNRPSTSGEETLLDAAGVKRALDRTVAIELVDGAYAYGAAFEHFD